jgi:hypothetical protein
VAVVYLEKHRIACVFKYSVVHVVADGSDFHTIPKVWILFLKIKYWHIVIAAAKLTLTATIIAINSVHHSVVDTGDNASLRFMMNHTT